MGKKNPQYNRGYAQKLGKIGEFIRAAYEDPKNNYTVLIDEFHKNIEIINMIGEILGTEVKYRFVKDRLGHDKRYSLSSDKYRKIFGDYECIKLHKWLEEIILK